MCRFRPIVIGLRASSLSSSSSLASSSSSSSSSSLSGLKLGSSCSGVFVVRDVSSTGTGKNDDNNDNSHVIYVGMSRNVKKSIEDAQARGIQVERIEVSVVHETTSAQEMRNAWKAKLAACVRESGALPPGNDPNNKIAHETWNATNAVKDESAQQREQRATAAWRTMPAERRVELCKQALDADEHDAEAALGLAEALDQLTDEAADDGNMTKADELKALAEAALVRAAVANPPAGPSQERRRNASAAARRLARARGIAMPSSSGEEEVATTSTSAEEDAAYARAVFDDYASFYDDHMVNTLGYSLPDIMATMLLSASEDDSTTSETRFAEILDLGCGTGLSGEPLREHTHKMIGVDVSDAMAEKARSRRCSTSSRLIYDDVQVTDLVSFLRGYDDGENNDGGVMSALVAMDTLNYLGSLDAFFDAASDFVARTRRQRAFAAISVEDCADDEDESGAQLDRTGRYLHGANYVRGTASKAGWRVVDERVIVGRRERGKDVAHRVFVFVCDKKNL